MAGIVADFNLWEAPGDDVSAAGVGEAEDVVPAVRCLGREGGEEVVVLKGAGGAADQILWGSVCSAMGRASPG